MIKRAFDIAASSSGLLAFGPLMVGVSALIKLTSDGPVLFRQERMGRGFRSFKIMKFRTMISDAEKQGPQITAGRDPRITPIGHVLRKSKLDELPQLINVLRGDMSFVGPRPEIPKYVEMFRKDYEELLKVRPGITDLASLKYRHESELLGRSENPEQTYTQQILPDKIELAKEYIERSSLLFDLSVIFRTLFKLAA